MSSCPLLRLGPAVLKATRIAAAQIHVPSSVLLLFSILNFRWIAGPLILKDFYKCEFIFSTMRIKL